MKDRIIYFKELSFFQIEFIFLFKDKSIRHMNTNRCLATQKHNPGTPVLDDCDPDSRYQQWDMSAKFKWQV